MKFSSMKNGRRWRMAFAMVLLAPMATVHALTACSHSSSLSAHGPQVTFAQARGAAGEHVTLYCDQQHADNNSLCDRQRYLLGGDQVRVIDQCGESAYVGYAGKTGLVTGWVRKDLLRALPGYEESLDWIVQAAGRRPLQQLSLQPPYEAFLQSRVPVARLYLGMSRQGTVPPLYSAVEETTYTALPEVTDDRYVVLTACRIHSCDEKGLIWIDLRTNTTVGAIVHFELGPSSPSGQARRLLLIWSNDVDQRHLPETFLATLERWNSGPVHIDPVAAGSSSFTVGGAFAAAHFIDRDGLVSDVDTFPPH